MMELVASLINALVILMGGHENARQAITEDEAKRANAAADAVAAARVLAGQ